MKRMEENHTRSAQEEEKSTDDFILFYFISLDEESKFKTFIRPFVKKSEF